VVFRAGREVVAPLLTLVAVERLAVHPGLLLHCNVSSGTSWHRLINGPGSVLVVVLRSVVKEWIRRAKHLQVLGCILSQEQDLELDGRPRQTQKMDG